MALILFALLAAPDYQTREAAQALAPVWAGRLDAWQTLGKATDPEQHARLVRVHRAVTIRELDALPHRPTREPVGWADGDHVQFPKWVADGFPPEWVWCPCEEYGMPSSNAIKEHVRRQLIKYLIRTADWAYVEGLPEW